MIHAYDPQGRPCCGAVTTKGEPVSAAYRRDLCVMCLRHVAALCRRLAP